MAEQTIRTLDDLRRRRAEIMALAGKCRARKIAVFGSLVRGEMRPDSDIDFLVDFEHDYKLRDHSRLMIGLEDLLGCKVDVVPRHVLRDELRDGVLGEAQAL